MENEDYMANGTTSYEYDSDLFDDQYSTAQNQLASPRRKIQDRTTDTPLRREEHFFTKKDIERMKKELKKEIIAELGIDIERSRPEDDDEIVPIPSRTTKEDIERIRRVRNTRTEDVFIDIYEDDDE